MVKRQCISSLELRSDDGKQPCIVGYAARFDSPSLDLGGFTERIAKGAFSRSLTGDGNDVLALWSHDWSKPIARRSAGTLHLEEDGYGLAVTIQPDDTSWSRDAIESVRSGAVKGMSFAFDVKSDSWDRTAKLRTLQDVDLYEVSLVTLPAYPATEAALRSVALQEIEESFSKQPVERQPTGFNLHWHERQFTYLTLKYPAAK